MARAQSTRHITVGTAVETVTISDVGERLAFVRAVQTSGTNRVFIQPDPEADDPAVDADDTLCIPGIAGGEINVSLAWRDGDNVVVRLIASGAGSKVALYFS